MSVVPSKLDATLSRMDYGRALAAELLMTGQEFNAPYAQPMLDAMTQDIDFVAMTGHQDLLSANSEAMDRHHFAPDCTATSGIIRAASRLTCGRTNSATTSPGVQQML
ncbi:MAG: hypothetical protein H7Z14_00120 [Anaerolineae bacterium]|nr:hypothetical protein [Phycisphaerae bacterium]